MPDVVARASNTNICLRWVGRKDGQSQDRPGGKEQSRHSGDRRGSSGSKASLVYTDICLKKKIHKINDKYTFLVKI